MGPVRVSGAWQKMRVNQGQEFVIGGYTTGGKTFDALVLGYYENGRLLYASRNGFTPALRKQLFQQMKPLQMTECPLLISQSLAAVDGDKDSRPAKMIDCRWLKPALVGQFEFVEWAGDNHLRHTKFIALREDKSARCSAGGPFLKFCPRSVEQLWLPGTFFPLPNFLQSGP